MNTTIKNTILKNKAQIIWHILLYAVLILLCFFGSPASVVLLIVAIIVDVETRGSQWEL